MARAQSFYQWVDDGRLATLKARDHRDQPNVVLDEMATSVWEARSFDGVPRIRKDMLVPTINTSQGGQRVPLVGMRYMTELELERAQGFPDGWTDVGNSKTQRIKQLGNSIYYPIADLIAYQITRYWNR